MICLRTAACVVCGLSLVRPGSAAPTTPQTASPARSRQAGPNQAGPVAKKRTVLLVCERLGDYTYWVVSPNGPGNLATLTADAPQARLALAPDAREVHVLDEAKGTLAIVPVAALSDGARVAVAPSQFQRVRSLVIRVLSGGNEPTTACVVTLADARGQKARRVLTAGDEGRALFSNVRLGRATLTAVWGNGPSSVTQTITVAPGTGGEPATASLALAGTAPTPERPEQKAPSPQAAVNSSLPTLPSQATTATNRESGGSNWISGVVGMVLLAGAGYGALRAARMRGVTVASALHRLGVEMPQNGQAGVAPGSASPATLPLPSLSELPAPASAGRGGNVATLLGTSTPRLVGVAGAPVGAITPLKGTVSIGRDTSNTVALARDQAVSRRHARIETRPDHGFVVIDESSSNGTFVNGARIQEQALRPGDELQIGSARFRFEN